VQQLLEEDARLIALLRAGDEAAFATLVERYQPAVLRLARMYVSRDLAEEIAQETWLAVLNSIDRFEQRATLKSWILRIAMNKAKTLAKREGRTIPFSALFESATAPDDAAVGSARFLQHAAHGKPAGWWADPPQRWSRSPEEMILATEVQAVIHMAIARLAMNQREVITLRDIEGLDAKEVSMILEITDINQRVLLHRARAHVRRALEQYYAEGKRP